MDAFSAAMNLVGFFPSTLQLICYQNKVDCLRYAMYVWFHFPFFLAYLVCYLPAFGARVLCVRECVCVWYLTHLDLRVFLFWHINLGIKMRGELFAYAQIQPLVYHWYETPKFVKLDDLKMNETKRKITTNKKWVHYEYVAYTHTPTHTHW